MPEKNDQTGLISANEVLKNLEKIRKECIILDVREPGEFRQGHIPGSVNIPLGELAKRINEIDRAREIILVCLSGRRARSASNMLSKEGYKAKVMSGGMRSWKGAVE